MLHNVGEWGSPWLHANLTQTKPSLPRTRNCLESLVRPYLSFRSMRLLVDGSQLQTSSLEWVCVAGTTISTQGCFPCLGSGPLMTTESGCARALSVGPGTQVCFSPWGQGAFSSACPWVDLRVRERHSPGPSVQCRRCCIIWKMPHALPDPLYKFPGPRFWALQKDPASQPMPVFSPGLHEQVSTHFCSHVNLQVHMMLWPMVSPSIRNGL